MGLSGTRALSRIREIEWLVELLAHRAVLTLLLVVVGLRRPLDAMEAREGYEATSDPPARRSK